MKDDERSKIEKFHFDEIILILLILTTDLSKYDREDLSIFNEAIEGRIEVLFEPDFLLALDEKFGIKNELISVFENLRTLVVALYESQWTLKLATKDPEIEKIKFIASRLMGDLNLIYIEPVRFMEDHFEVDW